VPGLVLETNISGCGLEDCGLGMSTDQYEGHDDIPTLIHFHENARNSLLILILIKDCSIQHGLGLPTCTLAPISPTWAATYCKTFTALVSCFIRLWGTASHRKNAGTDPP